MSKTSYANIQEAWLDEARVSEEINHRVSNILIKDGHIKRIERYAYDTRSAKEQKILDKWTGIINTWRQRVIGMLEGVSSLLAYDDIKIHFTAGAGLASTDGEAVYIGLDWFLNDIVDKVMTNQVSDASLALAYMKGLVYHELSHIFWTPRFNAEPTKTLRKEVQANGKQRVWKAYNILEDSRIERMFLGWYPTAVKYFTALVMKYIAETLNDYKMEEKDAFKAQAYLLLGGRDFLPKKVRESAREMFADAYGEKVAKKVDKIHHEYNHLAFPKHWKEGIKLVHDLAKILEFLDAKTMEDDQVVVGITSTSDDKSTLSREGKAEPASIQIQDIDNGDYAIEDINDEEEAEEKNSGSGESDESEESDDSSEESEEKDGEGKPKSKKPSASGRGGDSSDDTPDTPSDDFEELIASASEASADDITLDIEKHVKAIVKSVATDGFKGGVPESWHDPKWLTPVTPIMRGQAKKLASHLRNVFSQTESKYDRGYTSGRLNVADVMSARGTHIDVFDKWQDIGDAQDFEVVVLVDVSGSMSGWSNTINGVYLSFLDQANGASWAIRKAFSEFDMPVTIITYSDDATVISNANDKVSNSHYINPPTDGSTQPEDALEIASKIFRLSNAENKILVTLTDGQWNDTGSADRWVRCNSRQHMLKINALGVKSVLVCYEYGRGRGSMVPVMVESNRYNGHDSIVRLPQTKHHEFADVVGRQIAEACNQNLMFAFQQ